MTITLDQASKLCKLGIELRAEKDWRHDYKGNATIVRNHGGVRQPEMGVSYLPAYSAEELLKMTPQAIIIILHADGWKSIQSEKDDKCIYLNIANDSLTEMLADKLINDIENKRVTVEEINK